jgi:thiamine biosynthesis lipoprotein
MPVASPTRSPLTTTRLSRRDLLRPSSTRTGVAPVPTPLPGTWLRVHRSAMACRFEVTLASEDQRHVGRAHEALAEADRLETAWTLFRETSVLSDVNRRAADEPVAVDAELFALLDRCRTLHADVDGAFDITSTPLSRCWGFLARAGRLPAPEEIARARAAVGMEKVTLDAAAQTVAFTQPGVSLNLGAVGKGYAVGAIAAALRNAGVRHALVSAGASSIVALGGRAGGWAIDVCSRQVPGAPLARLRLRDAAMATSGAGEQFIEIEGRRYGHLIDPRTGWPASGVLSVTVVTSNGADADALATAFFIGGVDLARRHCERHPNTLALVTVDEASGEATQQPRGFSRGVSPRTTMIGSYAGAHVAVVAAPGDPEAEAPGLLREVL